MHSSFSILQNWQTQGPKNSGVMEGLQAKNMYKLISYNILFNII